MKKIQDPGNLGSMLRTALAANCKNIFLDNCVDIYSPKVLRSSAGMVFHANIVNTSINKLKKSDTDIQFLATNPRANLNYDAIDYEE